MLLTIDIGNTNTVLGVFDGDPRASRPSPQGCQRRAHRLLRGFEHLTFCMPCSFQKSETVGLSRSGSPSPAQTIWVGRGESASV
jgi:pantothenate kinase type III